MKYGGLVSFGGYRDGFEFKSGEALIFNGAHVHQAAHGLSRITMGTSLRRPWLEKTRVSLQIRRFEGAGHATRRRRDPQAHTTTGPRKPSSANPRAPAEPPPPRSTTDACHAHGRRDAERVLHVPRRGSLLGLVAVVPGGVLADQRARNE